MLVYLILPTVTGVISAFVVRWLLRHAETLGLVQTPNHRSSHTRPTATGGGIGFVLSIAIGGAGISFFMPDIIIPLVLALGIGALGFADDHQPIAAKWRLLAQALGFLVLILVVAGSDLVAQFGLIGGICVGLGLVVGGVWWINVFNFLDGIDGYAGSQALAMLWGGMAICLILGGATATHPLIMLMTISSTAVMGFLVFNWPPARIFMGDAGSTFLGFWIFALAIFTVILGWMSVWQWLILSSVFICDASVTLARRVVRGENPVQAHRTHAYQKLSRQWGGHYPVVRAAIATNILLVFPAAILAGIFTEFAPVIALWVLGLLAIVSFVVGAGQADAA